MIDPSREAFRNVEEGGLHDIDSYANLTTAQPCGSVRVEYDPFDVLGMSDSHTGQSLRFLAPVQVVEGAAGASDMGNLRWTMTNRCGRIQLSLERVRYRQS